MGFRQTIYHNHPILHAIRPVKQRVFSNEQLLHSPASYFQTHPVSMILAQTSPRHHIKINRTKQITEFTWNFSRSKTSNRYTTYYFLVVNVVFVSFYRPSGRWTVFDRYVVVIHFMTDPRSSVYKNIILLSFREECHVRDLVYTFSWSGGERGHVYHMYHVLSILYRFGLLLLLLILPIDSVVLQI